MGNPQYRQQWFETWLDNHRDIAPDVKIEFVQTKGTADIREKITMTALPVLPMTFRMQLC